MSVCVRLSEWVGVLTCVCVRVCSWELCGTSLQASSRGHRFHVIIAVDTHFLITLEQIYHRIMHTFSQAENKQVSIRIHLAFFLRQNYLLLSFRSLRNMCVCFVIRLFVPHLWLLRYVGIALFREFFLRFLLRPTFKVSILLTMKSNVHGNKQKAREFRIFAKMSRTENLTCETHFGRFVCVCALCMAKRSVRKINIKMICLIINKGCFCCSCSLYSFGAATLNFAKMAKKNGRECICICK